MLQQFKKQTNAYLVVVAVVQFAGALIHVQGAVLASPPPVARALVGVGQVQAHPVSTARVVA